MKPHSWVKIYNICSVLTVQFCFVGIGLCIFGFVSSSYCAERHVGSGQTYATINAAISAASGGDTVIVHDGTYSDAISSPPNGSAGAYTTIKALNDGGVVITGSLSLSNTRQYIKFEGLKWKYAGGKNILGDHIKFFRCGFQGGASSGNNMNVTVGSNDYNDTEYILLEDCWSFGLGGRYNFLIYNSNYVVLRRCVVRHDGGWTDGGDPEAGYNAYESGNVYFQNCITIDSNQSYNNWYAGFYLTGSGSFSNIHWQGCIGLNNTSNHGLQIDPKSGGTFTNLVVNNTSIYGVNSGSYLIPMGNTGSSAVTITNSLFGSGGYGAAHWNSGNKTLQNSIIFNVTGDKLDGLSASYSCLEGGGGTCSNCRTYDPQTNGLLYLTRIEDGSSLKTAGSGGGQIGPTILKKIGTSGTLYGESGWNTVANDNLWPWPYEDRIKSDMAGVSTRGFCAGGQTLTKYIWEFLGNPIPSDIYGDNPPPSRPTDLQIVPQ